MTERGFGRLFRGKAEKKGLWQKLVDLALTDVRVVAKGVDHASLEELEERLLAADFGVRATMRLVDRAEESMRRGRVSGGQGLARVLRDEVAEILTPARDAPLHGADRGPTVYLIVGVNGVGKTTSVAKLAHRIVRSGRRVMIAAADTYRAGAVEQLRVWAERVGADFVQGQQGGDPAAVAFDALEAARARGIEVVLIDTAGRLHTNRDLMVELEKIDRVVRRQVEGAPHETLLVLDATVGQNAIRQCEAFRHAVQVSGIILTKMDSSSRGGIIVALQEEFGVPVKLVGTGEGVEDMQAFDVDSFVEAVFGG